MKGINLQNKIEDEETKGIKKLKNNLVCNFSNSKKTIIKKINSIDISMEYDDINNINNISIGFSSENQSGGMDFNSNELKSIEIIF